MGEPTVNVGSEHVGHGQDGGLSERHNVTLDSLLPDLVQLAHVNAVQRVDQVHE